MRRRGNATAKRKISSKDLEKLHPHLIYGAIRSFCPQFLPVSGGTRNSGSNPGQELSSEDLEELQSQLTYGALIALLKALHSSLSFIAPSLLSWHVALVILIGAILTHCLTRVIPFATFCWTFGCGYILSEALFFIWQCWRKKYLGRVRPASQRLPAPEEPQIICRRAYEVIALGAQWKQEFGFGRTPAAWLEGWFLGTPIKDIRLGNIEEFFAWAFYTRMWDELEADEAAKVSELIAELCQRFNFDIREGYNPEARPMRINFDKMRVWSHPLVYYSALAALRLSSRKGLCLFGFVPCGGTETGIRYYRYSPSQAEPGVLTVNGEVVEQEQQLPIVFIHGLGVGLGPYLRFIRRLTGCKREIFVLELLDISQSGCFAILPPDAVVESIHSMLRKHGCEKACFFGHSYGTLLLSWLLRQKPEIVGKLVLLDPVCFLLSQPDVSYNFLYRKPSNWFSMLVANFVRWELFTANVLTRHFYWYHNVMWKEELPKDCVVVLSGNDDIINARMVQSYLEGHGRDTSDTSLIKVLWFESFFHGELLLNRAAQLQILDLL